MRHNDTASRVIDGEAVVLTLGDAQVNVLNAVATRIWQLVDGSRNVREIAEMLVDEFEVTLEDASADTIDFLTDLADKGILTAWRREA